MVMEPPSPQSVGREFVRQYYTVLNHDPLYLHRFYSVNSSFVHGGLESGNRHSEPVCGQQEIHNKIMQLNFRDCHAKIIQVDSHATLDSGVVIQVSGELSNDGLPMRRFMQTFVLAPQSPKDYYVHNDIFRYQDEVFNDDEPEEGDTYGGVDITELKSTGGDLITKSPSNDSGNVSDSLATATTTSSDVKSGLHNKQVYQEPIVPGSATVDEEYMKAKGEQDGQFGVANVPPSINFINNKTSDAIDNNHANVGDVIKPIQLNYRNDNEDHNNLVAVHGLDNSGEDLNSGDLSPAEDEQLKVAEEPGVDESDEKDVTIKIDEEEPHAINRVVEVSVEPRTYANRVKSGSDLQATSKTSGFNKSGGMPSESAKTVSGIALNHGSGFGKSFRGGKGNGGNQVARGGNSTYRDRYGNSSTPDQGNAVTGTNGNDGHQAPPPPQVARRSIGAYSHADIFQLFVGNLPLNCQEADLTNLFSQYGKVKDVHIHKSGPKNMPSGGRTPNYGFVIFDDESVVTAILKNLPIFLPWANGDHRLNVEEKKRPERHSLGGRGGFDRSSQEHIGPDRKAGIQQGDRIRGGGTMRGRGRDDIRNNRGSFHGGQDRRSFGGGSSNNRYNNGGPPPPPPNRRS